MRSEGYGYEQWALYPVDEPESDDYGFLLELSTWIKAVDPRMRIYANPGLVAASDLRPGDALTRLLGLIDIWQPGIGAVDALAPYLGPDRRWWIYQVGVAPAKRILPGCYRKLAWEADRAGARGFGFWSFSDTGGTTAWNDLDGVRPDWSAVYDSPEGIVTSRRWEGFKAGIGDYLQLAGCRHADNSSSLTQHPAADCAEFRRYLDAEMAGVSCR